MRKLCKQALCRTIVVGALRTIPKGLFGHLKSIGVNLDVARIQKTSLLGRARILWRVLKVTGCDLYRELVPSWTLKSIYIIIIIIIIIILIIAIVIITIFNRSSSRSKSTWRNDTFIYLFIYFYILSLWFSDRSWVMHSSSLILFPHMSQLFRRY